jgi:hypothetical protein
MFRKELKWANSIFPGTAKKLAGWNAAGNAAEVSGSNQAESEAVATAVSEAAVSDERIINEKGLWWFWAKIKTLATAFTGRLTAKHLAASWSALTDAATIVWDADVSGNFTTVTLAGNRTLGAITNPLTGAIYGIRVVQDATGGRTLAFNAQYTFPGTVTPILNSAIGESTNFLFFYDGSSMRYLNASGNYKLSDLFLTNQVAAGSDRRPIWIDSTGKLQKSAFVNFDETNKKTTVTGLTTTNTVMFEWLNSSLDTIAKFYNDQIAEFGGGTAVISILSGVISGGAYIEMNSNQAEGFRIIDKASQTYLTFVTTTGGQAVKISKKISYDYGTGFEKWHIQTFTRTSTTAGGVNLLSFVNIGTDLACSVEVNHLFAYATDRSTVIAAGVKEGVVNNSAGTVAGGMPTFTVLADPATTATWSMVADNTNKRVNINFHNTTVTGKTFDVALDYTYVLRTLPV